MRISERERDLIVDAVREMDPAAEIWLFGSRVDDNLKGGDIDLLIVSERIGFSEKLDLLVRFKIALGEQKIDLKILTPTQKKTDSLAEAVLPKAVRLG